MPENNIWKQSSVFAAKRKRIRKAHVHIKERSRKMRDVALHVLTGIAVVAIERRVGAATERIGTYIGGTIILIITLRIDRAVRHVRFK